MARILVVEDHVSVRNVIIKWIQCMTEHQVVGAFNGEVGRDLFLADPQITVVISDLDMPCMNGLEMYRSIALEVARRGVVFVWHCSPMSQRDEQDLRATLQRFFMKPGDMPTILRYIQGELDRREVSIGPGYMSGPQDLQAESD